MADDSDFTDGTEDNAAGLFALHDAAAAGDYLGLTQLLEHRSQHLRQSMETDGEDQTPLTSADDPYIQTKDQNECTPLHLAIINGHVEIAQLLVAAGADVSADCDGCPCLHLATCTGAFASRGPTALKFVSLLLEEGADPIQRDDCGRLALHWSAELGLTEVCKVLLEATSAAAAALTARVAAAAADADQGEQPPDLELPNLLDMQDNSGDSVLHAAAQFNQSVILQLLLQQHMTSLDPKKAALTKNKQSFTPLAAAAYHGAAAAAQLLLAVNPAAVAITDKHGYTPAQLAARRGHKILAAGLAAAAAAAAAAGDAAALVELGQSAADAADHSGRPRTLIVAPPECELHRTCPDPLPRGMHAPPENVERIRVLVNPDRGVLKTSDFANKLHWETSVPPAPLADVLRVHDWNYVRGLQIACQAIPDLPDGIAHLDPDTTVSHHTFHVALRAASAVCMAVDKVVRREMANAFCVVRPPGHHAGPRGIVTSKKDRTGSHGFCLLNNVAIGAAYAMNVHRHAGIQRVAILDFDVHHGNGTRACVSNTAPGTLRVPFSTPLSEGVHVYHTYQPWFDVDDDDNVLFASVQGYGPKAPTLPEVFVYPGSGATCDTKELKLAREKQQVAATVAAAPAGEAAVADAPAGPAPDEQTNHLIDEDPDQEFPSSTADDPVLAGPRIIDVGIPGPGFHPLLWRRAWRDKILPALVNFKPDLIMISAGFDAHRKDEINFRYIGVTEADYEWLTDQIVQVANRCCSGRVVSVLEGGYNINGGFVSAFARSVAAHVRSLAEPHSQAWDPQEAQIERNIEHKRKEERAARIAAKRAAALARLKAQEQVAAAAIASAAEAGDLSAIAGLSGAGEPEGNHAGAGIPADAGRPKRRRSAHVDYAALNAQLEAEAKAAGDANQQ